ncbi:DUF1439 domain-containing protein [Rhodoferax sp. PAMC 29310]|uniref:DUF1439 domain-containing protein n=1 Tax=Rhodoferax sp. PAMC 29310 TaxID=2822760 RepID=UPI001B3244BE|nr:DUF1439 domain-containing protein [Rhodoferax sp. PAMC 29310]
MRRRTLLPLALYLPLSQLTGAASGDAPTEPEEDAPALPRYKISAAQLQRAVAERFPLRYPVPGVLNMDLQAPHLRMLPAQNSLGAEMLVDVAGPALRTSHQGTLAVEFALRYEASDLTVRAHQLRFKRLTMPSLQPGVVALLNGYGPALTERALLEVVVHQLQPQDLALPNGLGMRPGTITVTDAGLVIGFVPKPLGQQ